MPELFDSEGNPVKAFTQEELDAQVKAKEDEFKAKEADKEKNFATLRAEKEAAEKAVADKEKEKNEAVAAKEKEKNDAITAKDNENVQKDRNEVIEKLSEGKKELKEKIEFHLKRFEGEIKTQEDFQRVVADAYALAAGTVVPDALGSVISSAGAKGGVTNNNKLPISAEALPVAAKLGVSEADLLKYGGQK